jgi:hypothetical protein
MEEAATFSMKEGLKRFVALIPIFHHNNLQFSDFIKNNNIFGTLFEE